MGHTITVRLTPELAAWLEHVSEATGLPQGKIIRDEIERVMTGPAERPFLRLAGSIDGPSDLSTRKGFSRPSSDKPRSRRR